MTKVLFHSGPEGASDTWAEAIKYLVFGCPTGTSFHLNKMFLKILKWEINSIKQKINNMFYVAPQVETQHSNLHQNAVFSHLRGGAAILPLTENDITVARGSACKGHMPKLRKHFAKTDSNVLLL